MTAFSQLVSNPAAARRYLVEVQCYNLASSTLETLYFSDNGFTTEPTDAPANQHYHARVKSAINFQRQLYNGSDIGGAAIPGFGTIVLANDDGGLDYLHGYSICGRSITVKLGGAGFAYSDYGVIFQGTAQSMTIGESEVVINIRDLQEQLAVAMQSTLYDGSGGNEGGESLAGKPKPLCFGQCYNISPILVDSGSLVYQFHDGQVDQVLAVYDKGAQLTPPLSLTSDTVSFTSSTKTIAAAAGSPFECVLDGMTVTISGSASNNGDFTVVSHTASTLVVSEAVTDESASVTIVHKSGTNGFTKDLANGLITLTNSPSGEITMDVRGAAPGGTYVSSVADIARKVVTVWGPLADPADLNTASFTALNTANSAAVGLYLATPDTILDALDKLVNSIGAFYGFNRAGLFDVGRLEAPAGTPVASFGPAEVLSNGLDVVSTPLPYWRCKLQHKPVYTVQSKSDLAGIVSSDPARFDFVTNEYRTAVAEDASVKTGHLLAQELEATSLLAESTAADTEAARLLAMLKEPRRIFEVTVKTQPFNIELNDVVQLLDARMGLDSGVSFRVVGIKEDAGFSEVTMQLWG